MALDLERFLIARVVLYRFLALGFHEPAEPLLALLTSEDESKMLREAAEEIDQGSTDQAVSQAVEQVLAAARSETWVMQDLRVEYNRLFIGPTPPLAPPYESVYDQDRPDEEKGTVEGPSAAWMANALASENLESDLGRRELVDHIAIELEFMYYLLSKAVEKDNEPDQRYVNRAGFLLNQHLAKWAPEFGDLVASKTNHPLYQSLGRLLAAVVRTDAAQNHAA